MKSRRVRSLSFLLVASLVAASTLAVNPADAAPGTAKAAKAAKNDAKKET